MDEAMRDTALWMNTIKGEHAHVDNVLQVALDENENAIQYMTAGTELDTDTLSDMSRSMSRGALTAMAGMLATDVPGAHAGSVLAAIVRGMWIDGACYGAQHQLRNT